MKSIGTGGKSLFPYWVRIFLLFLLADFLIIRIHEPIWIFNLTIYLVSSLLSLLFFYVFDLLYRLLPRIVRTVYAFAISFLLAFLLVATLAVYSQFGEYISVSMLQFVLNNPAYLTAFTRTFLFNINILGFLALWGLLLWIWIPKSRPKKIGSFKRNALVLLVVVVAYFVILNQLVFEAKGRKLTIDTSFVVAVKRLGSLSTYGLYKSERAEVQSFTGDNSLNVILLVNESFGKEAFNIDDTANCPMIFLREWLARDSEHFFVFRSAFSNSGATDVSVPSILTGVAPYESSRELHNIPLLWDWGRAGGYRTSFVSAQQFGWANFDDFFLTPGPDIYLGAEQMKLARINDAGVDEIAAMRRFCDTIIAAQSGKPFLAVYNSNALHFPYQQSSPLLPQVKPNYKSRYKNGAVILDEAFRMLYESLERNGLMDNTLLIITSDHGDADSLKHPMVHRLYSFYDEILNIPFLIHAPHRWIEKRSDIINALTENENRIVSNIDIVPTILAALGAQKNPRNMVLISRFPGLSLLSPTSSERYSIALSTNDIRQWEHEGFGIFWKNKRFVYSDIEKAQYFDILADPGEKTDIWSIAPDNERQFMLSIIDSTFHLKRMYDAR